MGVSLDEVIENQLLSEVILECIPHECECGAPIEFTDSLRQIYCSSSTCLYKVAARLESMAKKMKADGWGESTCVEVCRRFKLMSPYQVFLLEGLVNKGVTCDGVSAFSKKVASICDMEKRKVKLWEIVSLAGIPSIETTAYKIFDGYSTIEDAYKDIEKGQVPFIANKLGIKNSETGVMALNVYNTLLKYKEEILFGETQFDIYEPTGDTLYIAITGSVSGFRNKSEFIKFINDRYGGKVNAMLMNSVTSQIDILIADGDTSSNKFKNAQKLNNKHLEKGLIKGDIAEENIGKYISEKDLHPVGELIYVTTSDEVFRRLDRVYG